MAANKVQVKGAANARALYVDDVQVVKEQQTTIQDTTAVVNSNNVGDLPTTVNDILAALIAHGLIAPQA